MKKHLILIYLCLLWTGAVFAQPMQVKVLSSDSDHFTKVGNSIFFTSGDSLMKTDGTPAGTILVRAGLNQPDSLMESNGLLYFVTEARQLWRSDGTSAGTFLLKNFSIGAVSYVRTYGSYLYFTAVDGASGRELYRTDGTVSGTILLKDINTGAGDGVSTAGYLTAGSYLYFQGTDAAHGTELWRTDGTTAGTVLLKDVKPGTGNGFVTGPWALAGNVYFVGDDGIHGAELWITDGTEAGTSLIKDVNPGAANGYEPAGLIATANTVYFVARSGSSGHQLWKTNGTAAGTVLVKDFSPTSANSFIHVELLYTNNGAAYFYTYDEYTANEVELWRTDGTAAGTVSYTKLPIADVRAKGPSFIVNGTLYQSLYFNGYNNASLLVTDGTQAGSFSTLLAFGGDVEVKGIGIVNNQVVFAVYGQNSYFLGYYKSNGTPAGSGYFTKGSVNSAHDFTVIGNSAFFVMNDGPEDPGGAVDPEDRDQLFTTDLSTTYTLRSQYGTSFAGSDNLIALNGVLYFTTQGQNAASKRLWRYAPQSPSCSSTGSILREVWNNIPGTAVSSIPYNTTAPSGSSLIGSFEGPVNAGNLYGARYRGYLCVPVSGNYTFWIASDDESELWLSSDATAAHKVRIAYVNGFTNPRQWDKYASQKSASIYLAAGQKYYIEALHKESYGNDHLAVGWQLPGGALERPIPGTRLSPFGNFAPAVSITQPVNNENFNPSANVQIQADASDSDGTVTKVEFYHGMNKLGEDLASPYGFVWYNVPAGTYTITARAYDNEGNVSTSAPVTFTAGQCTSAGNILREYWNNVGGYAVSDIPLHLSPSGSSHPALFEGPVNTGNNYGARYSGYLCVPATGNYTFWIASDDNSELWLSTDDNPANKVKIASVNGFTGSRVWNKYVSQQSAPVYLQAGISYYLEALHKEAYGNDHLAVGWQLPDGTFERPIPGTRLSPYVGTHNESVLHARTGAVSSTEDVSGLQINVVPNPAGKGNARLLISGREGQAQEVIIEISNLQGQRLYEHRDSFSGAEFSWSIPVDERFTQGIYILNVVMNGETRVERLVVE